MPVLGPEVPPASFRPLGLRGRAAQQGTFPSQLPSGGKSESPLLSKLTQAYGLAHNSERLTWDPFSGFTPSLLWELPGSFFLSQDERSHPHWGQRCRFSVAKSESHISRWENSAAAPAPCHRRIRARHKQPASPSLSLFLDTDGLHMCKHVNNTHINVCVKQKQDHLLTVLKPALFS